MFVIIKNSLSMQLIFYFTPNSRILISLILSSPCKLIYINSLVSFELIFIIKYLLLIDFEIFIEYNLSFSSNNNYSCLL